MSTSKVCAELLQKLRMAPIVFEDANQSIIDLKKTLAIIEGIIDQDIKQQREAHALLVVISN
jgi:hypothetical protein